MAMTKVYRIESDENFATLFSTQRMPHASRKGPMDGARRELRASIEAIKARPCHIIEGVYSSQADGFFDVENVVFYNIESATFRNSSQNGLRARRCRLHDEADSPGYGHKLDYRMIPTPPPPAQPNVRLSFTPRGVGSLFDVWWAAGGGESISIGQLNGPYGLHVELGLPVPSKNPASKIKSLFDGIIASVQRDMLPDPVVVERLSHKHAIARDRIEARLTNPTVSAISALRSGRLVRQYGAGVIWRPADDLCEECTLIVTQTAIPVCNAYFYELDGR